MNIRSLFAVIEFVLLIILVSQTSALEESVRDNSCGVNVTWSLNSGKLTINGTGPMDGYDMPTKCPWYEQRDLISEVVVQEGVTSLGKYAFYMCSLNTISLPSTLTSIGDSSFSYCKNLTQLDLPTNLELIGKSAFYGCGISRIVIPSSLTSIGAGAFSSCTNLTSIDVEEGSAFFRSLDGSVFDYNYTTVVVHPPGKKESSYIVPESVRIIASAAFVDNVHLVNVTLPSGLISIGSRAFAVCRNLTWINIPSSVRFIGEGAFGECSKMMDVVIPDGLERIESSTFGLCSSVTQVVIPSSVKSIGGSAFYGCSSLSNVTIMNGVESIGSAAFGGCTSLKTMILPDSVKTLASCVFDSSSLTHLTLPSSITSIDIAGFSSSSLSTLFYQGSYDAISGTYVLDGCPGLTNICVPPYYNSTQFCTRNVTSDNEICQTYQGLFNDCTIPAYQDDHFIEQKRKNTTEWESQSDGCMEYECVEDVGFVSWSICNTSNEISLICVEKQCVEEKKIDEKEYVEIEMNEGVRLDEVNVTEVLETIITLCKIGAKQIEIGYEVDSDGFIVRVLVYVHDEQTAHAIADVIESLDKGDKCGAGVLCRTKSVRVVVDIDSQSQSSLSGIASQSISGASVNALISNSVLLILLLTSVFVMLE